MQTTLEVLNHGMLVATVVFKDQPGEPNSEFARALHGAPGAEFGAGTATELRHLFRRMYPHCTFHVTRQVTTLAL